MAVYGLGNGIDMTFKLASGNVLATTTSQYKLVSFVPGTSTVGDFQVDMAGATGASDATASAFYCIGVNQSYLSSGSQECTVRLLGVSKVVCAESIAAGSFVMAYWGSSLTSRIGTIVQVDNGVSCACATTSITSQMVILGRAFEDGSTGTVISVFVNPQLYDAALVGSIGMA